jgi:cation diffusion facilitator CzcD-associated flavoprotein CzcO
MLTFGYRFRPWTDRKVLADGTTIRDYLCDTAREYGVTRRIRFRRRVVRAGWSTARQQWRVEARDETDGSVEIWTCRFLIACTGYYDYDAGYRPPFPGEQRFTGTVVHPQFWPQELDVRGRRIVVIGSGATAVTLVPALVAEGTAQVVMLQRSPTYVMSLPAEDRLAQAARRKLPAGAVYDRLIYAVFRARNILGQRAMYALARSRPRMIKSLLLRATERQVGRDLLPHFTPRYDPWTQRLCMVPDGDLFRSVRSGRAIVVTDTIDTFTETGIRTISGEQLDADIIVTATGLKVQTLGGADLVVDGIPVVLGDVLTYKGVLIEGVPNLAMVFGYTNASWTLKADLACHYVIRLLKHMRRNGYSSVVARSEDAQRETVSMLATLDAGYVRRGDALLPRQGVRAPWRVFNNYLRDWVTLKFRPVSDGSLHFSAVLTPRRQSAPVVTTRLG